jgi:hypothetical protein
MREMDMGVISEAIKLATAPVFLLTGVGGILNVLGNRLARVIDRARWVQSKIAQSSADGAPMDSSLDHYLVELAALKRRKLIINVATAILVLSAVLIAMTVIELFFSVSIEPGKLHISNLVPVTFIGSFVSLVGSCVLYLIEILYASNTISFDVSDSSTNAM